MRRTKPLGPQEMLKNPTIHAVAAPRVDRDFRLIPRLAMSVATMIPNVVVKDENGFMFRSVLFIYVLF
jgi:hypothetical protein